MKGPLLSIITFCLIGLILCSSAQNFAEIGTKWTYTEKYSLIPFLQGPAVVEAVTDTLFQGKTCSVLQITQGKISCSTFPVLPFVYEDSGQVYVWSNVKQKFCLLYDFDVVAGDKWELEYYEGCYGMGNDSSVGFVQVDSVYQKSINGESLKHMEVTYYADSNLTVDYFSSTIIERLGDLRFLFPWGICPVCDESKADGLRCFSDSVIGMYATGIVSSCDFNTTSIGDLNSLKNVIIYPNPVRDKMSLYFSTEITHLEVRILDLSGKEVRLTSWLNSSNERSVELDLIDLNDGYYNCNLTYNNRVESFPILKIGQKGY